MTDHRLPTSRMRAANRAAHESRKLRRPTCPHCGAGLERVPRRWMDRLMSLLTPLRRYRCLSIACAWEGNLRTARTVLPAGQGGRRYERRVDGP